MLDGFIVGQYVPGSSFIHRLDPRTKIVSMLLLVIATTMAQGLAFIPIIIVVTIAFLFSRISLVFFWRGLKFLWILLLITFVLQACFTPGETLLQWGFLEISKEGLLLGGQMFLRVFLLIVIATLLTVTTTPVHLTAGIEILGQPLYRLGIPVHEIAMMITISLRFVPTILAEVLMIAKAQQARGAGFSGRDWKKKKDALLSILVPMFSNAFRRAEDLSIAMEARCYQGSVGRSRMRQYQYHIGDILTFMISSVIPLIVILWKRWG